MLYFVISLAPVIFSGDLRVDYVRKFDMEAMVRSKPSLSTYSTVMVICLSGVFNLPSSSGYSILLKPAGD